MVSPPRDRPTACSLAPFSGGRLLMGFHERRIDHHVVIIVLLEQSIANVKPPFLRWREIHLASARGRDFDAQNLLHQG